LKCNPSTFEKKRERFHHPYGCRANFLRRRCREGRLVVLLHAAHPRHCRDPARTPTSTWHDSHLRRRFSTRLHRAIPLSLSPRGPTPPTTQLPHPTRAPCPRATICLPQQAIRLHAHPLPALTARVHAHGRPDGAWQARRRMAGPTAHGRTPPAGLTGGGKARYVNTL
jgi:hypothetical protein